MDKSFNFSLFSRVLRVKNSMPIRLPRSFWLYDMWKCMTKNHEKHLETRLHSIRALNPRPVENLQLYKMLAKKKVFEFKVSELVI